jgi:hypothetical protein
MNRIFTLIPIIFITLILNAQTWTGSTNDRWDIATNWSSNAVPASNGAVIIPGTLSEGRPWPRLVANTSLGRLTMQSGSQLNTGGFDLTLAPASSGAVISISGATVTNPVGANTTAFFMNVGNYGKNINGSTFNGNFHFISTSANQTFNEANSVANTWNGNLTITLLFEDALSLSNGAASTFNGNVTINKTETTSGVFDAFRNGGVTISGDLTINKPIGGLVRIGHNVNLTQVNGRLFLNFSHNGTGSVNIQRLKNNTGGGTVIIKKPGTLGSITNNEFVVNSFQLDSMNGQISMSDLKITGNTQVTDYLGGPFYFDRNIFNGTFSLGMKGGTGYDAFADAAAGNIYKGDALFEQLGGNIIIGYSDTSIFEKDFTFNTNGNEDITRIRFAGSEKSTITKMGSGTLSISRGEIAKSSNARVILASPVAMSVNNGFMLNTGHIQSSSDAPLRLNNLVSLAGGSLASHVIGPIDKVGIAASSLPVTYPIGSGYSYNPITQSNHGGNNNIDTFRAQYILQNPGSNGLSADSKTGTLSNVSKAGYWLFNRISGERNVNLTFSFGSNPYHDYPGLANLKVAQWTGSQWEDKGNGGTTGTSTDGTITHTGNLSTYTFFALANQLEGKYWYAISHPGTGPDGTPVKVKGIQGFPAYQTRQLPGGLYSADSIYLLPNGGSSSFRLRDMAGVEKDDTSYQLLTPPATNYVLANATGTVDLTGWRHFVYIRNASNEIIGAIRDNNLNLGTTTMQAYFANDNIAQAPNGGQHFLKRSFRVTSTLNPSGTRHIRLFISKIEMNNLATADPEGLPNGINSLHLYRYTGAQEDAVFNPRPGGTTHIIPPSAITKTDLGTMWGLEAEVPGFSGFHLAGAPTILSICPGSSVNLSASTTGTVYQWQVSTGGSFSNLTNNATYSGAGTATLTINNAASSLYGNIYRCRIDGNTSVPTIQIKFNTTWQGTANTLWNNPSNWPCGVVPDANTDVVVKTGALNIPAVNINSTVRTLKVEPGASVNVANGVTLTVLK